MISKRTLGLVFLNSLQVLAVGVSLIGMGGYGSGPPNLILILSGAPFALAGAIGVIGCLCMAFANLFSRFDSAVVSVLGGGVAAFVCGAVSIWIGMLSTPPVVPLLIIGAIAGIVGAAGVLVSLLFAVGSGISKFWCSLSRDRTEAGTPRKN